jgi:hypothetical protein
MRVVEYISKVDKTTNIQITMPVGARILKVFERGDPSQIHFAALVNPDAQNEQRFFQAKQFNEDCGLLIDIDNLYVGTVNTKPMPVVWHVFEVLP